MVSPSPYDVTAGGPYTPVWARDCQPPSFRKDHTYAMLARI